MHNKTSEVFFYKLPIEYAITDTGVIDVTYNKNSIYINTANINAISISDDNTNWSIVDTDLKSKSPTGHYISFIVPMEVTELVEDLNTHTKKMMYYKSE